MEVFLKTTRQSVSTGFVLQGKGISSLELAWMCVEREKRRLCAMSG